MKRLRSRKQTLTDRQADFFGREVPMNRLRFPALVLVVAGIVALAPPLSGVTGPHSVDALTIDGGEVTFTEDGYDATYTSASTGRRAVLSIHEVSNSETDPASVEATFELTYSDGFQATGTGMLVIGILAPLPGPPDHPFGIVYVLGHLSVESTNRPGGGPWPKAGDELILAGELHPDATVEGAVRVVRPD
jgi:hypothetical protein